MPIAHAPAGALYVIMHNNCVILLFHSAQDDSGTALTLDHNFSIHATETDSNSHNSGNVPTSPDLLVFLLEGVIFYNGDDLQR